MALGPDGQPVADDPYCRPQQVGEITKIEEWFQTTWLGNPSLWQNFNELSGVQGFKGPVDQGMNGNFGFHKGVNWAIPALKRAGIGFQAGGVIAVSDLSGSVTPVNSTREQYFVTSGLFRRATRNSGWQGGAVVDYLHDNFYIKMDLLQVRSEISYIYHSHELGFWSAVHIRSDKQTSPAFFSQQPTVTWQANDQFNMFYRYTFCNGGVGRTWGGLSGVGDIILGSDALAPLSERWAIQAVTNYLIPRRRESAQCGERKLGRDDQPDLVPRLPRAQRLFQPLPPPVRSRRQRHVLRAGEVGEASAVDRRSVEVAGARQRGRFFSGCSTGRFDPCARVQRISPRGIRPEKRPLSRPPSSAADLGVRRLAGWTTPPGVTMVPSFESLCTVVLKTLPEARFRTLNAEEVFPCGAT